MIIKSKDFQDLCTKILASVDSDNSALTETLQIKARDNCLAISVTNREYFVQVRLDLGSSEDFDATVNANLFLKLIAMITTDSIELSTKDASLIVKGNGVYKLPLIYDGEKLLELPELAINNVTNEFDIDSTILLSILQYNSKELSKGYIFKPVQRFYYIDDQGAITFTTGACVNSFHLEKPIKLLFNNKIVKLFKLFKDDVVHFTLGYDAISDDIVQTKVRFESKGIIITAILSCDDTLLASVPVEAIRRRANNNYPYSINIDKTALIQAINRMMLFSTAGKGITKPYSTFEFEKDYFIIYDTNKENQEKIYYINETNIDGEYSLIVDLSDLKVTLENCAESYLTMNFGDSQALVIARGSIKNVVPEMKISQ